MATGPCRRGDPVNPFAAALLSESHLSQDGCKDHPRAMNPSQGLVQADGPAGLGAGYLGRPDGKVSGGEIQAHRRRTQSGMQVPAGAAGLPSAGESGSDERGGERRNRYQAEPLMDLEHVRASVKQRLGLGIALGLSRSDAEILQRRLLRFIGRARRRLLSRLSGRIALRLPDWRKFAILDHGRERR